MNTKYSYSLALVFFILLMNFASAAKMEGQTQFEQYGAYCTNSKRQYGHQEDSLFAMHSVMKFPQALYVADYLRRQGQTLEDGILVCKDSLDAQTWSPMLATFEGSQFMSFATLLRWSLQQSDNNACDLLFASCGMPREVETYIQSLGFRHIHIRLTEKEMRQQPWRSIENAATPRDMVGLMEWLMKHKNDNAFLAFVWDTMAETKTGAGRIAAIVPQNGRLYHKTGTGFPSSDGRQDRNDVGIIVFPDGSHLSLAIFVSAAMDEHEVAAIAENLFLNDDSSSSDSGSSGRRESSDSSDSGVLVKKIMAL